MFNIPVQFETLLEIIDRLSVEQQQMIQQHLAEKLDNSEAAMQPRIAGLNAGMIWTSDDFDDPLPDEFWLGEDA